MAGRRRIGAESSETRARILDAAEQVMRDEGYAAASSRRVAQVAEVKPPLVHYYFPTTDDLLMALFHRGAAQSDAMIDAALADPDPVRALWRFFTDTSRTTIAMEFMALASHRKAIRTEIARHGEAMRTRETALFARVLAARGLDPALHHPAGVSIVLAGIGRTLVMEQGLGIMTGHDQARAIVERWIDTLLAPAAPPVAAEPDPA